VRLGFRRKGILAIFDSPSRISNVML